MLLTGHMGDRISNKDVISSGPLRIMFAYRSNADDYSAQMVRCDPDPDVSELMRDGPCTTVRQMLSVDDRPDLESVARATSVTSTINKAIGDTQNVVIAMLENNTRWTAQENLFLVAASRARQSTIFFGDYNYFSRRASARVRGCLQTLEARNMVIRPQVWDWDWRSLPCVRVATQVWATICERAAQRDRGDPTGSRAADAFAASAAEVKAALEFRRVQPRAHCEKDPRTVPRTRGSPEVFGNPSVVIERDDDDAGGGDDDMEGVPTVPLEAPLDRSLSLQAWMAIRAGHVDRDVVRAAMVNTPPEHQWVDVRFSELGSLVKLLSYVDHRERIETYLARFIALAVRTIQVWPDMAKGWMQTSGAEMDYSEEDANRLTLSWSSADKVLEYLRAHQTLQGHTTGVQLFRKVRTKRGSGSVEGGLLTASITVPLPVAADIFLFIRMQGDPDSAQPVFPATEKDALWSVFGPSSRRTLRADILQGDLLRQPDRSDLRAYLAYLKLRGRSWPPEHLIREDAETYGEVLLPSSVDYDRFAKLKWPLANVSFFAARHARGQLANGTVGSAQWKQLLPVARRRTPPAQHGTRTDWIPWLISHAETSLYDQQAAIMKSAETMASPEARREPAWPGQGVNDGSLLPARGQARDARGSDTQRPRAKPRLSPEGPEGASSSARESAASTWREQAADRPRRRRR